MKRIRKPTLTEPSSHLPSGMVPADRPDAAGAPPETMRFDRILLPTDFSDASKRAFKYAARFVEQFGSRVTLLYVREPAMSADFTNFPLALDEDRVIESAKHRLLALARTCLSEHCIEDAVVRTGNPFHEIAATARELKIDLIIIATHGYAGVKRALLGSTTERVVRHAQCPVMTVR